MWTPKEEIEEDILTKQLRRLGKFCVRAGMNEDQIIEYRAYLGSRIKKHDIFVNVVDNYTATMTPNKGMPSAKELVDLFFRKFQNHNLIDFKNIKCDKNFCSDGYITLEIPSIYGCYEYVACCTCERGKFRYRQGKGRVPYFINLINKGAQIKDRDLYGHPESISPTEKNQIQNNIEQLTLTREA